MSQDLNLINKEVEALKQVKEALLKDIESIKARKAQTINAEIKLLDDIKAKRLEEIKALNEQFVKISDKKDLDEKDKAKKDLEEKEKAKKDLEEKEKAKKDLEEKIRKEQDEKIRKDVEERIKKMQAKKDLEEKEKRDLEEKEKEKAKQAAKVNVKSVQDTNNTLFDDAAKAVTDVKNAIITDIKAVEQKVVDTVVSAEKKVVDTVVSAEKKVVDTVVSVEQNIVNDVKAVEQKIVDTVVSVEQQAVDAIKSVFRRICNVKRTPPEKMKRMVHAEHIFPHKSKLNLPKSLDLRSKLMPIRDQGSQGACAAFAASCIKEYQELVDCNKHGYMSPQWIYNNREDPNEEGMYPQDVFNILKTKGCCSEKNFPYGSTEMGSKIPKEALEEALKYKILSSAPIYSVESTQIALYKNGPVYIAIPVYNFDASPWKQETPDQELQGGHAVTIVGYTEDNKFIIRNSWGVDWADKGYTYIPFEEFPRIWEVWTAIDELSSKPDITNEPSTIVHEEAPEDEGCCCFGSKKKVSKNKK